MALVEAVLTYKTTGTGCKNETAVSVGKTDDPLVLRALRDRLLEEAHAEALMWRAVDPGVAAMQGAELERLARVLSFLLPDEDLEPGLRLVDEVADNDA